MTLRQYLAFLKMEDNLSSHAYYVKAASSIVQCYLDMHDNPALAKPHLTLLKLQRKKKKPDLQKKH